MPTQELTFSDIATLAKNGISDEKKSARSKPEVTIEIGLDSAPDCAIRRKTANSSRLLVLMPTQNLFCIMDEKTKKMTPINTRNILNFATKKQVRTRHHQSDVNVLELPWWAGGDIEMSMDNREIFLKAIASPRFADLLRMRGINYNTLNRELFSWSHQYIKKYNVNDLLDEQYSYISTHQGFIDGMRDVLCNENQGTNSCIEPALVGILCNMCDALGADRAHDLAVAVINGINDQRRYTTYGRYTNPEESLRQATKILANILNLREDRHCVSLSQNYRGEWSGNLLETYYSDTHPNSQRVVFDTAKFNDYTINEATRQGVINIVDWLETWSNDLMMQVALTGHVSTKYPKHLLSHHQLLVFELNQARDNIYDEQWKVIADSESWLDWSTKDFIVTHPHNASELADEAVQQNNCVRSYQDHILNGTSHIAFLRKADEPDNSWVTVEISNSARGVKPHIVQAKSYCNNGLNAEQEKALAAYCAAKNIRML